VAAGLRRPRRAPRRRLGTRLEVTRLVDLSRWPTGMRAIIRKERPHPGAQLRLSDAGGQRLTAFATNTAPGGSHRQPADLEFAAPPPGPRRGVDPVRERHRADQPAPCTRWTRTASGAPASRWPANSPPGPSCSPSPTNPRRCEPKRLRLRLFSLAGGSPAPHSAPCCTYPTRHPGPSFLLQAITNLQARAAPG
jgi:hypothetical protein